MLNLETRLHVRTLWAVGWTTRAIARYLGLAVADVQALIDIFEGRYHAVLSSCDRCRVSD